MGIRRESPDKPKASNSFARNDPEVRAEDARNRDRGVRPIGASDPAVGHNDPAPTPKPWESDRPDQAVLDQQRIEAAKAASRQAVDDEIARKRELEAHAARMPSGGRSTRKRRGKKTRGNGRYCS